MSTAYAWKRITTQFTNAAGITYTILGIKTVPAPEFTAEDIDVTSQDDDVRAFISGLSEGNEIEFIMNDYPDDTGQAALVAACDAQETGTFILTFPSGRSITFGCSCKTASLVEDNKAMAMKCKVKVSGTITRGTTKQNLSGLTVSTGTLFPAFGATTYEYYLPEINATATVAVTPTSSSATIKVNGTAVTSGAASGNISLTEGALTKIGILVTRSGYTSTAYTIWVGRATT